MSSTDQLEFYDLSHPWGFQAPNWPYFKDVQIERIHYMAKSGVLTQEITTTMHSTTHIDAPAHVVEGTPFIDEISLDKFFGTGVVVSIPKGKFEMITGDDLEAATPRAKPGDVLIINTGWHKKYADGQEYFGRCPGLVPSAADWIVDNKIKVVGHDTQANDHPLATAIGPHGPGGGVLMPYINKEYEEYTGNKVIDDFPEWEPVHRKLFTNGILGIENVGGDIDKVTGKRCTFSFFPWRWTRGDGCIIRLVAMLDPTGDYRIESGSVTMRNVVRIEDALKYSAPLHDETVHSMFLQHKSTGGEGENWVSISYYLPGAKAEMSAAPLERTYVVLDGQLTVEFEDETVTLGPLDSVYIGPNETREARNDTNHLVTMLVVMPYPPEG